MKLFRPRTKLGMEEGKMSEKGEISTLGSRDNVSFQAKNNGGGDDQDGLMENLDMEAEETILNMDNNHFIDYTGEINAEELRIGSTNIKEPEQGDKISIISRERSNLKAVYKVTGDIITKPVYDVKGINIVHRPNNTPVPDAAFESVRSAKVNLLATKGDESRPSIQPNDTWRHSTLEDLETCLEIHEKGIPMFLSKADGSLIKDENDKPIEYPVSPELLRHIALISGQQGSGKSYYLSLLAWYFTKIVGAFTIVLNTKGKDFLSLDCPASQSDDVWKHSHLNIESEGIEKSVYLSPQTGSIEPRVPENSKMSRYNFSFDVTKISPGLITSVGNFSKVAERMVPAIFRAWQSEVKPKDTLLDFIKHVDNSSGRICQKLPGKEKLVKTNFPRSTQNAMVRSLVDVLKYFDAEKGDMLTFNSQTVKKGRLLMVDTVEGSDTFSALVVRHLMKEALDYQQRVSQENRIPIIFLIDEAHKIYGKSTFSGVTKELEDLIRLGRGINIGVALASQSASKLDEDVKELSQTKIIFRSDEDEAKRLNIPRDHLSNIHELKPGLALVRTNLQTHKNNEWIYLKAPKPPVMMPEDPKINLSSEKSSEEDGCIENTFKQVNGGDEDF